MPPETAEGGNRARSRLAAALDLISNGSNGQEDLAEAFGERIPRRECVRRIVDHVTADQWHRDVLQGYFEALYVAAERLTMVETEVVEWQAMERADSDLTKVTFGGFAIEGRLTDKLDLTAPLLSADRTEGEGA